MSPTIRIDEEVYKWLQGQAEPFEDTPNLVLRRIAGFDKTASSTNNYKGEKHMHKQDENLSGRTLNDKWKVGARHALYHKEGCFYENLVKFPGALFDPNGYMLFEKESDYLKCPYLKITKKTNVPEGVSSIPGYKRMR